MSERQIVSSDPEYQSRVWAHHRAAQQTAREAVRLDTRSKHRTRRAVTATIIVSLLGGGVAGGYIDHRYAVHKRDAVISRDLALLTIASTAKEIGDGPMQRTRKDSVKQDQNSPYNIEATDQRINTDSGEIVDQPERGDHIRRTVHFNVDKSDVSYEINVVANGVWPYIGIDMANRVDVTETCADGQNPASACADDRVSYVFIKNATDTNTAAADSGPLSGGEWTLEVGRGEHAPQAIGADLDQVIAATADAKNIAKDALEY